MAMEVLSSRRDARRLRRRVPVTYSNWFKSAVWGELRNT
jgi:hypothetical protein